MNDLLRSHAPITDAAWAEIDKEATRTLKVLARAGMVVRTVHPTAPPQVEYALTALGRSLSEPVLHLGSWAMANLATIHANRDRYDDAALSRSL